MARRDANLAGLAALGALGYQLFNQGKGKGGAPVEDRSTLDDLRSQEDLDTGKAMLAMQSAKPLKAGPSDEEVSMAMDAGYMGGGKKFNTETGELYSTTAAPAKTARKKTVPAVKKPYSMTSDTIDENVKQRPKSAPQASSEKPRQLTRDENIAQIPGSSPEGWTGGSGDRIDSTELGRNASNIMNATAGLSVPGYVGKMTQAQYNARAAARRAAGELTEAEIAAAKAAQREKKTMNPMAWMAGPKGMAENFKKGGAVKAKPAKAEKPAAKGWGKARGVRAAKYY